ncbi:MAG: divergent polysaccharide deacetylase family protein [Thermodesulfobacteriota bacterium]
MARRRKARRGRRRLLGWAGTVVLALLVGLAGGYLYRELPRRPEPPPGASFQPSDASRALRAWSDLVGPLDPRGTRVAVADRAAGRILRQRLEAAAQRHGARVVETSHGEGALGLELRAGEGRFPVELWWSLPPALPPTPLLAIVIDDLGRSREEAQAFLDLPLPITPAILPHLPLSSQVAHLARERGREVLLHLPMQPQGYPERDPGEGALLEGMDEEAVRRSVARNLVSVPGAAGVNNHMGSRLTELELPMRWVMNELAARGLYFLDSLTSPRSVAAQAAGRAGLRWARRDVFLDNDRDEEAVGRQIEKAVEAARAGGFAVAIGHPHAVTHRALARWAPAIEAAGVQVVPLGEGLRRRGGGSMERAAASRPLSAAKP